jgi:hypothetical protein
MNGDFFFLPDVIYENKKRINIYRIHYKKECIAFFRESDVTPEKTFEVLANEYVATYGYMAEHRRQWNNGNRINWSEKIKVK